MPGSGAEKLRLVGRASSSVGDAFVGLSSPGTDHPCL